MGLLTLRDVATRLRKPIHIIHYIVKAKKLRAVRLGIRGVRCLPGDLEDYMKESMMGGEKESIMYDQLNDTDDYLTPRAVSKILKVSRSFVLGLVGSGEIESVKLGYRTVRISRKSLVKYIVNLHAAH